MAISLSGLSHVLSPLHGEYFACMKEWTDMSERKQEEAYFYKLNHELIESQQPHPDEETKMAKEPDLAASDNPKSSLYDFLARHLQLNEHWLADI